MPRAWLRWIAPGRQTTNTDQKRYIYYNATVKYVYAHRLNICLLAVAGGIYGHAKSVRPGGMVKVYGVARTYTHTLTQ